MRSILIPTLILLGGCAVGTSDLQLTPDQASLTDAKKAAKVEICHHTEGKNEWNIIEVSESAVSAHMAHGDAYPGTYYVDSDGDGYGDATVASYECPEDGTVDDGSDCDDGDSAVSPAATELAYDGIDNDCDAGTLEDDLDSDGYLLADDCNDADSDINPGAGETTYDGIDNDCDAGTLDDDLDSDGYVLADDCNDANGAINPGAGETTYDGIDNDCDAGTLDDDLDSDGYVLADDCNDADSDINPGAGETTYDGIDNDCDAATLDDDLDGDGYVVADDCNDANGAVSPAAIELAYDGIDNDCDAATLDDDLDSDGYVLADDCNDANDAVSPAAIELAYDGIDNDCDAATLDDDLDGDGYVFADDCNDADGAVSPAAIELAYDGIDNDCDAATLDDDLDSDGFVFADDCNDADGDINPGEDEVPYDGIDNDCDAATLDDDLDADGFVRADECDDADASVNPGAGEVPYDSIDNDCDAATLDDDLDADGYVFDDECNDDDAGVNPGADEACDDGIDNDCDGDVDEDCSTTGLSCDCTTHNACTYDSSGVLAAGYTLATPAAGLTSTGATTRATGVSVPTDGLLEICPGEWSIEAILYGGGTVVGAGVDQTFLSDATYDCAVELPAIVSRYGNHTNSKITAYYAGNSLSVQDMTFTNNCGGTGSLTASALDGVFLDNVSFLDNWVGTSNDPVAALWLGSVQTVVFQDVVMDGTYDLVGGSDGSHMVVYYGPTDSTIDIIDSSLMNADDYGMIDRRGRFGGTTVTYDNVEFGGNFDGDFFSTLLVSPYTGTCTKVDGCTP